MNTREIGTLAIRLMAVFQLLAAVNFAVTWIATLLNGRQSGPYGGVNVPSGGGDIGGLVVVAIAVAIMVVAAKFLWERAPAIAYMCLVPFNSESAATDTATKVDWPVLAFSCLGTWILVYDIPLFMQLLMTLLMNSFLRGGSYGGVYSSYLIPSLLGAAFRVLLGFYLLFRARQVASLVARFGG